MLGSATARNTTCSAAQITRPTAITRRGPHRSDSAPDAHAATPAATPYTVKISPTCPWLTPWSSRNDGR